MLYLGRYKVLKTQVSACDYDYVIEKVESALRQKKKLTICPTTSHVIAHSFLNRQSQKALNFFDIIVPDSQWVKWAIWFLYGKRLKDRVYGPTLMGKICAFAERKNLAVFLVGWEDFEMEALSKKLNKKFPRLKIKGQYACKNLSAKERLNLVEKFKKDPANIVLVGLGGIKQNTFVQSFFVPKPVFKVPVVVIPVGAAFGFIAGLTLQAPRLMQDMGLEWLFRLLTEPKRLWTRYLVYGPLFVLLVLLQKLGLLSD